MSDTDWAKFVSWAQRVEASFDMVDEEHAYKRTLSENLRKVAAAAQAGEDGWPALLTRALRSTNLMSWQFASTLKDAISERPDQARDALLILVRPEATSTDIDAFATVAADLVPGSTAGNLTSLASVLLMAAAEEKYPPYRAAFVEDWARLTGHTPVGDASPRERYEVLLSLCDELLVQGRELHAGTRLEAQGVAWTLLKSTPPCRWEPLERAELEQWRSSGDAAGAVVRRGEGVAPLVEAGAWTVLLAGLMGRPSAFDDQTSTWTVANAQELQRRLTLDVDAQGGFVERLVMELDGADKGVVLLAAELLYLRNVALADVKASTKRTRLDQVLALAPDGTTCPTELGDAMDARGAFAGGQGYHPGAPKQLDWLARFVEHWLSLSDLQRETALRDPMAFHDIGAAVAGRDVPSVRFLLDYLAYPGVFPSVISLAHRTAIRDGLISDIGPASGRDDRAVTADLVALWCHHRRNDAAKSKRTDWYLEPYRGRWQVGVGRVPRAWLVRQTQPAGQVSDWMTDGSVSLTSAAPMRDGAETTARALEEALTVEATDLEPSRREDLAATANRFLNEMGEDDIVCALSDDGAQLHVGVISGPAARDPSANVLRRDVEWSTGTTPVADLTNPLPTLLDRQGTVLDLTEALVPLRLLVTEPDTVTDEPAARALPATDDAPPRFAPLDQAFADNLLMPVQPLQGIVDLLQARQQIVLYGPPGTGKTYLARKLARRLVSDPSHVRLVQFHPSYAYEDFFEGYRPQESGGTLGFTLRPGPLKLLAEEAVAQPSRPFVLVIDEMNRANLAKVFGELYFLLEYRNESVQLQYGAERPFRLPRNLFIIGTMNTTDRSVALVDAAIRRRFPFVEMHPSTEPVSGVLSRLLAKHGLPDDRARLLQTLNSRMGADQRDLQLGPSYFMREDQSDAGLKQVWLYDVLPLLEEHYFGAKTRDQVHAEFALEDLLRGTGAPADPNSGLVS